MFDIQNDFVDGSVPSYQVCPTTIEPPLDMKLCQFSATSSMVETEPVLAQAQSLAYGSGFINPLVNEEFNNSISCERSAPLNLISKAGPWESIGPTVFKEQLQSSSPLSSCGKRPSYEQSYIMDNFAGDGSVQNPTSTLDDSTARGSRTVKGIRIRHRQPHLSSNIIDREQGLATRRICLQSCKNEDGEYLEHHIAEEWEVSGPNLHELEDFSYHRDNSTSADIADTPAASSVRLRKKLTDDTGNELETCKDEIDSSEACI